MKKLRLILLIALIGIAGCGQKPVEDEKTAEASVSEIIETDVATKEESKAQEPEALGELRGVWISYHEWQEMPVSEDAFDEWVVQCVANVKKFGLNTIFLHVRADADAMYPSKIFPWSSYVTGTQGKNPGYDPLEKFIEVAHDNDVKLQAWINPYRVAHKDNPREVMCAESPALKWLNDGESYNDRWVLEHDGDMYFNPAVQEVRELILDGVKEILENYDVDGIHLDDYFYPTLDDENPERSFDLLEYQNSQSELSVTDWRRENVNILIRDMYRMIKEYNAQIELSISPAGNIDNLYSDKQYFSDVALWMSEDGYIDCIIPQLYWGFEIRKKDGTLAPYAFENNLNRWIEMLKNPNVKLCPGLPMYIAGTDVSDRNEVSEWLRHDDVIKRMVEYGRDTRRVDGFVIYSFASFFKEESQKEVSNLMEILK